SPRKRGEGTGSYENPRPAKRGEGGAKRRVRGLLHRWNRHVDRRYGAEARERLVEIFVSSDDKKRGLIRLHVFLRHARHVRRADLGDRRRVLIPIIRRITV